jgi:hypothetical protein
MFLKKKTQLLLIMFEKYEKQSSQRMSHDNIIWPCSLRVVYQIDFCEKV